MFRRARLVPTAVSLALGALVLTSCTHRPTAATSALPGGGRALAAEVGHVIDGDTVDLVLADHQTERVRLLGIDTPETVKPNTPVQCFGPEASAQTKRLLPEGTAVLIQRDREARDRYGRLLVYLWRATDHLFVNGELVSGGFARTLSIEPNTSHRADLAASMAEARAARRGLWASCPPQ